jgi:hypothetical protein
LGKARNGTGNSPNCRRLVRTFELNAIVLRQGELSVEPVSHANSDVKVKRAKIAGVENQKVVLASPNNGGRQCRKSNKDSFVEPSGGS